MSKSQNPLKVADRYLLSPYGLGEAELEKTFRKLMRHDIDFADLYFQYQRSEAWSLEEGIVKSGSFDIEQGVGVRAISGEKTAFRRLTPTSDSAFLPAPVRPASPPRTRSSSNASAAFSRRSRTSRRRRPTLRTPCLKETKRRNFSTRTSKTRT